MSDSTPGEMNSNSKANLIQVHHVGVTAKIQSPLAKLIQNGSSTTDSDNSILVHFGHGHKNRKNYNAFTNDSQNETETTTGESNSQVLYEMRSVPTGMKRINEKPSRIEFQRYNKKTRFTLPPKKGPTLHRKDRKHRHHKHTQYHQNHQHHHHHQSNQQPESGFFQRLRQSLDNMCNISTPPLVPPPPMGNEKLIDGLPEPKWNKKSSIYDSSYIGIYPFDHGCSDYLSITDNHPRINSLFFAERTTYYATHFWAEFFGILYIAIAFVVTFVLQTYRFVLYSLVNTLLVGLLHMTSDYLIKPLLTVTFNGFIQPPMIFMYNILSSVRDMFEPVAEIFNNLMKPLATVGNSLRLIHVNYNNRHIHSTAKETV